MFNLPHNLVLQFLRFLKDIFNMTHETGCKLISVNKMWVYDHINIASVNFRVELLTQPQDLFCNMSCGWVQHCC